MQSGWNIWFLIFLLCTMAPSGQLPVGRLITMAIPLHCWLKSFDEKSEKFDFLLFIKMLGCAHCAMHVNVKCNMTYCVTYWKALMKSWNRLWFFTFLQDAGMCALGNACTCEMHYGAHFCLTFCLRQYIALPIAMYSKPSAPTHLDASHRRGNAGNGNLDAIRGLRSVGDRCKVTKTSVLVTLTDLHWAKIFSLCYCEVSSKLCFGSNKLASLVDAIAIYKIWKHYPLTDWPW